MPYVVHLKRSAEKELAKLPREAHQRNIKRLLTLKANPRPPGAKKLGGGERHRIRVAITGCCTPLTMPFRKSK